MVSYTSICTSHDVTEFSAPTRFAEEYDVNQRQLRGNLPQAFVHAVMLKAAVRLADLG